MPDSSIAPDAPQCDFRLEEFLPYQLSVAANRVYQLFARRYSDAFGLSIPEWRVLATIARFGTVSPTAVVEWAAMNKVQVSRATAALIAQGLVRQSPDPRDGRGRLLRITRKGATTYRAVVPMAEALEAALAEALGQRCSVALRKALVRLNAHVQGIDGPDHAGAVD